MLIRVQDGCKSFGRREVLARVTGAITPGRLTAVTGPSGAGKTTLLRVLGGELALDSGTVDGFTADGRRHPPRPDLIAWVTQQAQLLGHRSARDNVALAGLARGLTRTDAMREADHLLDSFGLAGIAGTAAGRASGGERQRLCVCRALATARPVILADEPSANLDARSAGQVVDALAALAGRGVTVVVATHDPAVIAVVGEEWKLR
jgi:ABC-type multidrug transport system ATPase subunit